MIKRYETYKHSGSEFIGEIPIEWECKRLSTLGNFSSSGIDKKTNTNETPVRMVNYTDLIQNNKYYPIQTGNRDYMRVTTSQSQLNKHRLERGDIVLIPSSETNTDLGYSSLIDFDETDIVYSYHLILYRIKKPIYHYFKKYLINYHPILSQFSRECKGTTRKIIGRDVLNNIKVVIPPLEEQELITRYLDKKTEQIDLLIERIQKKIELLKEQRTSLINQYVTKGLDPNVEMKDSGVEWIGEIPVHWNRVRVKNLVSTKITDGPHETPEFVDTGIPFLSVEGVVDNQIDFNRVRGFISKETHDVYSKKCKPRKDDILLVKSGSTTGKSTIVDTDLEFNIWSPLCILRSNIKKILPLFLFNSVQSSYFRTQIEMGWSYGTQPNIGMGVIENLWIFLPPIEEQKTMNLRLVDLAKPIDVNVQKNIEKIELLKEYRQSIISSVVTGKVRVTEDML